MHQKQGHNSGICFFPFLFVLLILRVPMFMHKQRAINDMWITNKLRYANYRNKSQSR